MIWWEIATCDRHWVIFAIIFTRIPVYFLFNLSIY